MQWLRQLFSKLFTRKSATWDGLDYGKPSAATDDFRQNNEA